MWEKERELRIAPSGCVADFLEPQQGTNHSSCLAPLGQTNMNNLPGVDDRSESHMSDASFGGDSKFHENEYLLEDDSKSGIPREKNIHEDDGGGVALMKAGQSQIQGYDGDSTFDIGLSAVELLLRKAEEFGTPEELRAANLLPITAKLWEAVVDASNEPNPASLQGLATPPSGTSTKLLPSFPIHVNAGDFLELDDLSTPIIDYLPYKLVGNLGHGGSASVEMIEDIHTGKVYARKIIRGVYARNIKAVKRELLNEVNIMKRLAAHHHMVKIHATYISRRELAMILDPVASGGDLASFIEEIHDTRYRGDRVSNDQLDILHQSFGCLAAGLAFMHRHTIRHKDIKPQNILIHDGIVLFTDFGLSYDFADAGRSTTVGLVQGMTKRYCAPEVANGGSRNSKADIFSLGCVYLEIINALLPNILADDLIDGPFHEKIQELTQSGESFWNTATLRTRDRIWMDRFKEIVSEMLDTAQSARPSASQLVRNIWEAPAHDSFCIICWDEYLDSPNEADKQIDKSGFHGVRSLMKPPLHVAFENEDRCSLPPPPCRPTTALDMRLPGSFRLLSDNEVEEVLSENPSPSPEPASQRTKRPRSYSDVEWLDRGFAYQRSKFVLLSSPARSSPSQSGPPDDVTAW